MKYNLVVDETNNKYAIEADSLPRVGDSIFLLAGDHATAEKEKTEQYYNVRRVTHTIELREGNKGQLEDAVEVCIEEDK